MKNFREWMCGLKEWGIGIALLCLTPFLLVIGILVALFVAFPIWIYMLYNEMWADNKTKQKNLEKDT